MTQQITKLEWIFKSLLYLVTQNAFKIAHAVFVCLLVRQILSKDHVDRGLASVIHSFVSIPQGHLDTVYLLISSTVTKLLWTQGAQIHLIKI